MTPYADDVGPEARAQTAAGDSPNLTPWVGLGLACAAALGVYLVSKSRDGDDEPDGPDWLRPLLDAEMADAGGLDLLRDAILGSSKKGIAKLLGSPRAAGRDGFLVDRPDRGRREDADVWYYPVDKSRSAALGVRFQGGRAVDAEFFRTPPSENR